jgi:hypothetical protein
LGKEFTPVIRGEGLKVGVSASSEQVIPSLNEGLTHKEELCEARRSPEASRKMIRCGTVGILLSLWVFSYPLSRQPPNDGMEGIVVPINIDQISACETTSRQ